MSGKTNKDKQECYEIGFLFKHLGVKAFKKQECPDFVFECDGKCIGLEHTRSFPNKHTIEIYCWKSIEQKIKRELNKSDLEPKLIGYSVKNHKSGENRYKEIAQEILNGLQFMNDNGINSIDIVNSYGFKFNNLVYLSYFKNYVPEQFVLSEMVGGVERKENYKSVVEAINKKDALLPIYKQKENNSNIQEFWLSIFIPTEEFCVMEKDYDYINSSVRYSGFDRIYLTNSRYIGRMQKGDTSNILRLK